VRWNQTVADSDGRGLTAVSRAKLAEEPGYMMVNRARAEKQPGGYFGISKALAHQFKRLLFAASEIEDWWRQGTSWTRVGKGRSPAALREAG
jgi:hypothetical protein